MNRKGLHRQGARNGRLQRALREELGAERYERLRRDSLATITAHDERHGTRHAATLRPQHRVALRFSTLGREADDISRALRESPQKARQKYAGLIAAYNGALDLLPPHPGVVWRGLHFEGGGGRERLAGFLDQHQRATP